ncbi:hypothetical protein M422DRAFT_45742 [Sphaerobolus stellatus SS14]|nr:hypothetical protein M422DRAFT_45742 [Sphaerobolus stellatus SS14]
MFPTSTTIENLAGPSDQFSTMAAGELSNGVLNQVGLNIHHPQTYDYYGLEASSCWTGPSSSQGMPAGSDNFSALSAPNQSAYISYLSNLSPPNYAQEYYAGPTPTQWDPTPYNLDYSFKTPKETFQAHQIFGSYPINLPNYPTTDIGSLPNQDLAHVTPDASNPPSLVAGSSLNSSPLSSQSTSPYSAVYDFVTMGLNVANDSLQQWSGTNAVPSGPSLQYVTLNMVTDRY